MLWHNVEILYYTLLVEDLPSDSYPAAQYLGYVQVGIILFSITAVQMRYLTDRQVIKTLQHADQTLLKRPWEKCATQC